MLATFILFSINTFLTVPIFSLESSFGKENVSLEPPVNSIERLRPYSAKEIIPGIISLALYGLNLSIEFTGGSRLTFSFPNELSSEKMGTVKNVFIENKIKVASIQKSGKLVFVRTQPLDQKQDILIIDQIKNKLGDFKQEQYETVGPTIGSEITLNAI